MHSFSLFFKSIGTVQDLRAATTATYLMDIVLAIVCFVLLVIVANAILYERGRVDNSWKKRRLAFYIIGFICLIGSIAFNFSVYFTKIRVAAFQAKYLSAMLIAAFVGTILYFALSFAVIKFISHKDSKLASIFPRK